MKVGFYQFAPEFGRREENISAMIKALSKIEADIIVLPELATSGYLFTSRKETDSLSETVPGRMTEQFAALSDRTGTSYVIGFPEKAKEGIYNSAAMINNEGVKYIYRKTHLFFEEKKCFSPGNKYGIFEYRAVKVGILVCFDHMFPEAARSLALNGAQVICHPSNLVIPEYGQLTTRVRALENRVFWILANRIGTEERNGKKLEYTGESQIISPKGEIIKKAGTKESGVFIADIDPAEALNKQVTEFNHVFNDRRTDIYTL